MLRNCCRLGGTILLFVAQLLLVSSAAEQSPEPDSPEAFRKFFGRLMNANRMPMALDQLADEVLLPDHKEWFSRNFTEAAAPIYAERYEKARPGLLERLRMDLNMAMSPITLEVKVERWNKEKESQAEGFDKELLRTLKEPLWYFKLIRVVRADGSRVPSSIYFFVDGAFRYFPAEFFFPEQVSGPGQRLRVGGNVQMAKLISQVRPIYPPLARQAGVQGTVRLQAIIAKDGSVAQLEVISGHSLLVQAALDAVRQWRYMPTLLEGQPVEVITLIDVIFSLRG
jgi:TonB family protein